MRALIAVAAALTIAAPLAAQNTTATAPVPAAAPGAAAAPTPAAAPASAAATVAVKYTVDTPLETIVADPAGKAVIDSNMPGLTTHAMFDQFKSMSLKQLAPMSGGRITEEALTKVAPVLAAVK